MTHSRKRRIRVQRRQQQQQREQVSPQIKIQDISQPYVPNANARTTTFKKGTTLLVKGAGGGYLPI